MDLTSEDFSPERYIVEKYKGLSFEQLKEELERLKVSNSDKTSQLKTLVLDNFDQFIASREVIRVLSKSLGSQDGQSLNISQEQDDLVKMISEKLAPMMDRLRQQNQIHSALDIIKRHRVIVDAPRNMMQFKQQKLYSKVVDEYNRLKWHMSQANTTILQPVLKAADTIAKELSDELIAGFTSPNVSRDQQEQAIALLEKLHFVEHPRVVYIEHRYEILMEQLDRQVVEIDTAAQIVSQVATTMDTELWTFTKDTIGKESRAQWVVEIVTTVFERLVVYCQTILEKADAGLTLSQLSDIDDGLSIFCSLSFDGESTSVLQTFQSQLSLLHTETIAAFLRKRCSVLHQFVDKLIDRFAAAEGRKTVGSIVIDLVHQISSELNTTLPSVSRFAIGGADDVVSNKMKHELQTGLASCVLSFVQGIEKLQASSTAAATMDLTLSLMINHLGYLIPSMFRDAISEYLELDTELFTIQGISEIQTRASNIYIAAKRLKLDGISTDALLEPLRIETDADTFHVIDVRHYVLDTILLLVETRNEIETTCTCLNIQAPKSSTIVKGFMYQLAAHVIETICNSMTDRSTTDDQEDAQNLVDCLLLQLALTGILPQKASDNMKGVIESLQLKVPEQCKSNLEELMSSIELKTKFYLESLQF